MKREGEIICSDMFKSFSDRGAACDSTSLLSAPDWELTSFQRAPALLDTYTFGLLAKFLPTDPATRAHDTLLHTDSRGFSQNITGTMRPVFLFSRMENPGEEKI